MKLNYTALVKCFMYLCLVFKITVACFGYLDENTKELKFSFSFSKKINNDEIDLASRAYNLRNDRGLVKNIYSKDSVSYKLSSNRPMLNIGIHYLYQSIYSSMYELKEEDIISNKFVDKNNRYYHYYSIFINCLSLIVFLFSIIPFRNISFEIGIKNGSLLNFSTGLYFVFPSSLLYIGCIPLYENISLPISIIFIDFLFKIHQCDKKVSLFKYFLISILLTIAVMIRPQMLIPSIITLGVFILLPGLKNLIKNFINNICYRRILIIFSIIFVVFQSAIIIVNYKYFNAIFYTNRGDAMMWGHYELAKGSWDGTVDIEGSKGYIYQREIIPGFDSMSEIEQDKAQRNIAKKWIIENPIKEFKLILKKIAIFFMPYNFDYNKFNLIMFFTHLGFAIYFFQFISKFNTHLKNKILLLPLVFVFGVLFVNVMFFVEYRVKYFADPYLLMFSILAYNNLYKLIKGKFYNKQSLI